MELVQITEDELQGELQSRVYALLDEAFPPDRPAHMKYYDDVPARIMILRDGEVVAGHLTVYEREAALGDEPCRIGLLGGIAVAPSHRGRGHVGTLVRAAHGFLNGHDIPFSVLFAYEPKVYRSCGYKPMANETHCRDYDGTWKTLVYPGGMYAELAGRAWPGRRLDLRGGIV